MKIQNYKKLGIAKGHFRNGIAFFDLVSYSDIFNEIEEMSLDEKNLMDIMKDDEGLLCFGRLFEDGRAVVEGVRGFIREDIRNQIDETFEIFSPKRTNGYYYTELKLS